MRPRLLVVMVTMLALAAACGRGRPSLDAAVAAGDWTRVAGDPGHGEPRAARLLHAHAALALKRNNQAVCGFAAASADDLQACHEWTQSFAARYPRSAVAHYLRGDALARRGDWGGAVDAFDASIRLDPATMLNARGVARSLMKDSAPARSDFSSGGPVTFSKAAS